MKKPIDEKLQHINIMNFMTIVNRKIVRLMLIPRRKAAHGTLHSKFHLVQINHLFLIKNHVVHNFHRPNFVVGCGDEQI